jgi:hypothetical protein
VVGVNTTVRAATGITPVVSIGITISKAVAIICKARAAAIGQRRRLFDCDEDSRRVSRNIIPSVAGI